MTIILYILLTYYMLQLAKSESFTLKLTNDIGDLFKKGEENNNEDAKLSGTLGFIFMLLPLILIRIGVSISLIYLIITGVKSTTMFYPSITMAVIFVVNFIYGIIKNSIKSKNKKDKYAHLKTKRSFKSWVILILNLIYVIWYLIVI